MLHSLKSYKDSRSNLKDTGVLLLDGDWLVYKSMSAAEVSTNWGNDVWTLECDHKKAWSILKDSIESFKTRKKAWSNAPIILAFTDSVNWRKTLVDTSYKENRAEVRKPVGFREFKEKVFNCDEWVSIREDSLEGDDIMAIIGSNPEPYGFKKAVLISCDKDFKTVPNCSFLWCTTGNILNHSELEADYWHIFQTIKGDITDGYSGIPGVGDKVAEEWLTEPYALEKITKVIQSGKRKGEEVEQWVKVDMTNYNLWTALVTLGLKAGMTEQDLINQARMARLLRWDEYDCETKEITLWGPTSLLKYDIGDFKCYNN